MSSAFKLPLFVCTYACSAVLIAQVMTPPQARRPAKEQEIKLGEDEVGCKDSPLMARIAGCSIIQCDSKPDAEAIEIQVGSTPEGLAQKEQKDGSSEVIYYLCPSRVTPALMVKQSEAALVKAGYKIIFSGRDGDDFPIVSAMKDTQWLQVSTYMYNENAAYIQTAVKVSPDDEATAEAMAEEMTKNGRVVLTSINFAKDGADLATDSEKVLADIAAFLVRQPDWRIRVEGHTSNVGEKSANLALSQQRASSVATWLLDHGIDKSRLTINGLGDTKPVADNATAEGKAKNNRIELVRF
jgi:outer membrane protein OmpA-like peptidoglycan-associated protein